MCVVTLLPLPDGFVLTSNRDEVINRPAAIPPRIHAVDGHQLCFPKDPQGGGTWLASSAIVTICLLNGAFEKHPHRPPYKKSRGLVVLDSFGYDNPRQFMDRYDFGGIEPCTMVFVSHSTDLLTVYELRWTGEQTYLRELSIAQPHIWSSVALYTESAANLRKTWLADFLMEQPEYTAPDLFRFHQTAGDGNPDHDFVMDRSRASNPQARVQTMSVTQVTYAGQERSMRYLELASGQESLQRY